MLNLLNTSARIAFAPADAANGGNVPTKTGKTGRAEKLAAAKARNSAKREKAAKPVHFHREAGLTGERYSGLSSYLNSNRPVAVKLSNYPRTEADIAASPSPRTPGSLFECRDKHGDKQFPARGLDNAICAMLINAGLLSVVSGTGGKTTIDGVPALIDLPGNPLRLTVTARGKAFGKA